MADWWDDPAFAKAEPQAQAEQPDWAGDPAFNKGKQAKPAPSAWRSFVDTLVNRDWGNTADVVSQGVQQGLTDALSTFETGAAINPLSPQPIGTRLEELRRFAHQRDGMVAGSIRQNLGPETPQDRGDVYAGIAARGAASMAPLMGAAPVAALVGGAGSGVGGQAGHDLFPNSDIAPLVGSLVGGMVGGGPEAVRSIRTGSLIRAGMSHPDYETLINEAILPNEGGGTLEHPKVNQKSGAEGVMQVTPETARDPGYGIRPWDGKSQADLARVGRQKFAVLLGKYNDPEKALAAYDWGEGNLNKAVRKYGHDWYDHAPEETQNYVAKGMTRVYGGPLKGVEGPDGLPTNGSVVPIDSARMANIMQDQGMIDALDQPKEVPVEDVLTPAEKQEMDASVERPPTLNNASDRMENFSTNEKPSEPANDVKGPSIKITPETWEPAIELNRLMAARNDEGIPEFADADVHNIEINHEGRTSTGTLTISKSGRAVFDINHATDGGKLDIGPAEVRALSRQIQAQFPNIKSFAGERTTGARAGQEFTGVPTEIEIRHPQRDTNPPATSSTFGTSRKPPSKGPKGPEGHDEPPQGPSSVDKLQDILKQMDELRSTQDQTVREIRQQRYQEAGKRSQMFSGEQGAAAQMSALKGKLPQTKIRSFRKQFGQEELDDIFKGIQGHPAVDFQTKLHATTGLQKLLNPRGNKLPTRSELDALHLVFPKDMVDGLKKHSSLGEIITNTLSIPRALMASADFSAPFRQGVFLIGRKQFYTALPKMFKNAFFPKDFRAMQNEIASRPTYEMMQEGGLSLTDITRDLTKREEAFRSRYAENIPGVGIIVEGSDRAYVSFLNKVRADVFDDIAKNYEKLNGESIGKNPKALKALCDYINAASGRGSLGKFTQAAPFMSAGLFAPRLIASRLQLLNPFFYAKLYRADPMIGKEAIKDLLKFGGMALTVLGLAKMAGLSVEADPRSTDFGKIRIGDTRFDILGGFQQYIRAAAQLIMSQTKNSDTGKVTNLEGGLHGHVLTEALGLTAPGVDQGPYKPTTGEDVIKKLVVNKEAPIMSFVDDIFRGSDQVGNKLNWKMGSTDKMDVGFNWNNPVIQRVIPLVTQDTHDALKEYGVESGIPYAVAVTGTGGVGTQTYQPIQHEKKSRARDKEFDWANDQAFGSFSSKKDGF